MAVKRKHPSAGAPQSRRERVCSTAVRRAVSRRRRTGILPYGGTTNKERPVSPVAEASPSPVRAVPADGTTIRRQKLSELVVAGIKNYILEHGLGEGDRLPTEQQMAERFGVSRLSVREATKALSFLGILRSAPRRGLTVGRVDMQRVTEYLGFHFALNHYPRRQLLTARVVIETGALPEAMEAIADAPQLVGKLSAMNDRLRRVTDTDEFIAGDLAFHRALIECSGIGPLVAFSGLLEVFFMQFRDQVDQVKKHWAKGINGHDRIVAALRDRLLPRADELLREHLRHYRGHL